jgi:uroporphyrinogen-III synthase
MSPRRQLPLADVRVLVGRARHQAGALSKELRSRGATILEIPFIEIRKPRSYEALDEALLNLANYDWLILTSANGVDALAERVKKLRLTRRAFRHLETAAIGPATSKAMKKEGLRVDVIPDEYVAESVVKALRSRIKNKRVLLVRAKVARDVIPVELRKAGATVDVVEAYETVVPLASRRRLQTALKTTRSRPDVITFTSSSTAKNFVALLGLRKGKKAKRPKVLEGVLLASIGPVTSATLREVGLAPDIEAHEYTIPGLVHAIEAAILAEHL